MNLFEIRPGMTIETTEGSVAEVIENMEDGQWLLVRYKAAPKHPELVDTEELCHAEVIVSYKAAS